MDRRPRRPRAERVAGVLDRVLRRSGLYEGLRERQALSVWPEVVGRALARVTEPLYLKEGMLVVRVAGASWRAELHYLLPELRERINARLDKPLREIRLVSGRVSRRDPQRRQQPLARNHSEQARSEPLERIVERARRAALGAGRASDADSND